MPEWMFFCATIFLRGGSGSAGGIPKGRAGPVSMDGWSFCRDKIRGAFASAFAFVRWEGVVSMRKPDWGLLTGSVIVGLFFQPVSVMIMAMKSLLLLPLVLALVSCGSAGSMRLAGDDSAPAPPHVAKGPRTLYVERQRADDQGLHRLIADEFNRLGYRATTGEPGQSPRSAEGHVIYLAEWRPAAAAGQPPHLVGLRVRVLDPLTGRVLRQGRSQRLPFSQRTSRNTVRETLYVLVGIARPDLATDVASRPVTMHANSMPR